MNNEQKRNNKNYDLKSEAVEKLTGADSREVREYSQEELDRYRSQKGLRIPNAVKMLVIKAWFCGAVCYFFLWGLGTYVSGLIDMLFVLGVALGMVTDLLTNNVLRFLAKTPGSNDGWMMVPRKGMAGFFLNILYSMVVLLCVYLLYNLINYTFIRITGDSETVFLGVEPILFGIFCLGFDMLFIGMKRLLSSILRDARAAVERGSGT